MQMCIACGRTLRVVTNDHNGRHTVQDIDQECIIVQMLAIRLLCKSKQAAYLLVRTCSPKPRPELPQIEQHRVSERHDPFALS